MEKFSIIDFNKFFEFGLVGVVVLVLILIIGFLLHWVKQMAKNTMLYNASQIENTTKVIAENTAVVMHVTQVMRDVEKTVRGIHEDGKHHNTNDISS